MDFQEKKNKSLKIIFQIFLRSNLLDMKKCC